MSYIVLYGFDVAQSTNNTNLTEFIDDVDMYAICGKDDCQNAEDVAMNMNQYRPANPITLYILIGILMTFHVIASLIFIFLVPDIGTYVKTSKMKESNRSDDKIELKLLETSVEKSQNKEGDEEHKISIPVIPTEEIVRCTIDEVIAEQKNHQASIFVCCDIFGGFHIQANSASNIFFL